MKFSLTLFLEKMLQGSYAISYGFLMLLRAQLCNAGFNDLLPELLIFVCL